MTVMRDALCRETAGPDGATITSCVY